MNENKTLCEEDCDLIDYSYKTEKAKCSCKIKLSLPFVDEIYFDKTKLIDSLENIRNFANLKLLNCYKIVFNKDEIKNNYGFIIHIIIFISFFICMILFISKYYFSLKNDIDIVIKAKNEALKEKKKKIKNTNVQNTNNNINRSKSLVNRKKEIINENRDKSDNKPKRKSNNKSIVINFPPGKNKKKVVKIKNNRKSQDASSTNRLPALNNINIPPISNINERENNKVNKEILKFNENELNLLAYKKALIKDNRTFFQYYISLLKNGHIFFFSFYINNKDYNSQIIKISLFFFLFIFNLFANSLFFDEKMIHQIFLDEGEFNIIYQLPYIIISTIISSIIISFLKFLSLTSVIVFSIKAIMKRKGFDLLVNKKLQIMKIKFIIFFIVSFFLLFFSMFYVSCFCGIYVKTQTYLIKDSVISFGWSLVYPFGIYLIPGIFRLKALNAKEKNKQCLYKFSQIIQELLRF